MQLAAGIPRGNGICQVPLHVSITMAEAQLYALAETLGRKEQPEAELPDPREYHQEWARNNLIPSWIEAELWERKRADVSGLQSESPEC